MRYIKTIFLLTLIFLFIPVLNTWSGTRGILNQVAPSWGVSEWFNLPEDKTSFDVQDFREKVIYLYCFQSWCPGCHKYGFPTLQQIIERYDENPRVAIIAIQTTFEGFWSNTFKRAKKVAREYNLSIPIGQSGSKHKRSMVMKNYRTGGTPWVIIIDKKGFVRYNDFHIRLETAFKLIDELKIRKPTKNSL